MRLSVLPGVTDASRFPELREQADGDLCARLLKGIYTYLVMVSVLAIATDAFQRHPHLTSGAVTALANGLLVRLGLILGRKPLYAQARRDGARWWASP